MGWHEPGWGFHFKGFRLLALPFAISVSRLDRRDDLTEPPSAPVRQTCIYLTVLCVGISYATEPKEVQP